MPQYIEVISKIKPKNFEQSDFKIIDLSDIQININTDYNVLCANSDHEFTMSGINWDLLNENCTIGGDLHLRGNLYQYSDKRLKKNIIQINNSLKTISLLQGVSFNWINNNKFDYGVIAQQVEKIIPQAVTTQKETGYKQVNYIMLIPFLLQAIKELTQKVQQLQEKIM